MCRTYAAISVVIANLQNLTSRRTMLAFSNQKVRFLKVELSANAMQSKIWYNMHFTCRQQDNCIFTYLFKDTTAQSFS